MPAPEIGTVMEDGTVYAGISPVSGKGLFVMSQDAPLLMTENMTAGRLEVMNRKQILGHNDWRLPTIKELNILFGNREKGALSGTFNMAGVDYGQLRHESNATGWYRSSTWGSITTKRCKLFKDGNVSYIFDGITASVRFIREGNIPEAIAPGPAPYVTSDTVNARQDRLKKLAQAYKPSVKSR